MEKLKALLKSRKFWAAVVGLAMIFVKAYVPDFPLSEDAVLSAVLLLVSFILGTGIEDAGRAVAASRIPALAKK